MRHSLARRIVPCNLSLHIDGSCYACTYVQIDVKCIQYFLDNSISTCSLGLALMPLTHGRWRSSPLWIFTLNFTSRGGTEVWHHTVKSWRKINAHVQIFPPTREEEVLNLNLWWHREYQGLKYHGQSISSAQERSLCICKYLGWGDARVHSMALLNLHNIIVNTINLLNITCTLVATCMI